jgi:hypothetical protein
VRFRIRTIMIAVTILALIAALAVQTWRTERLRARLQGMEAEKDVFVMQMARLSKLWLKEHAQLPGPDGPVDDEEASGRNGSSQASSGAK